jgi:Uma2 family endonuclease
MRFAAGLVRCPSVAFFSWDNFPDDKIPNDPITDIVPDLVIEVLRSGNTKAETDRRVGENFDAGVRLVWLIDPATRSAQVCLAPHRSIVMREDQSLDGGEVLPGFSVALAELFRDLPGSRKE